MDKYKYNPFTLNFSSERQEHKAVIKFFSSYPRKKGAFVCSLVNRFLAEKGITDIDSLSRAEIRKLIDEELDSAETRKMNSCMKSDASSSNADMVNLLTELLSQAAKNISPASQPEKTYKSDNTDEPLEKVADKPKRKSGFFQNKPSPAVPVERTEIEQNKPVPFFDTPGDVVDDESKWRSSMEEQDIPETDDDEDDEDSLLPGWENGLKSLY